MALRNEAKEDVPPDAAHWRVGRARFALFLPIGLLFCALSGFLLADGQLIAILILPIPLLLLAWAIACLVWPPELHVSLSGLRYSKWGKVRSFTWSELDGPHPGPTFAGGTTLAFNVRSTGEQLSIAPSLFDCRYAELADIMNDAKAGRVTTSAMRRKCNLRFWF